MAFCFQRHKRSAAITASAKECGEFSRTLQEKHQRSDNIWRPLPYRCSIAVASLDRRPQCRDWYTGYDFQGWFNDVMEYGQIVNRRPNKHGGRESDGFITHAGTTQLVELKFERGQASAPDIDTFFKKVTTFVHGHPRTDPSPSQTSQVYLPAAEF